MGRILSTIFADHFSNPTKPEARRRKQAQAPRLETLSIAWDGNNGFRRCWRLGWSRRGSASAVSWSLPRARARRGVWSRSLVTRFNARVAHRLRGRPRFALIKARDLESLATA